ncbi:MAG: hypothetical protein AAFQ77_03170 [Myxococcota bacterium]
MRYATSVCLSALLLLQACDDAPEAGATITSTVTGTVSLGAVVAGASVELFVADDRYRAGELILSTTTADDGSFALEFPERLGRGVLCARNGQASDLATDARLEPDDIQFCALIPELSVAPTVTVNAWTTLVTEHARARIERAGASADAAYESALRDWRNYLACNDAARDVVNAVPQDPTADGDPSPLNDALLSGLLHAALSQQAVTISEGLRFAPGGRFTSLTLLEGLLEDIRGDTFLDGLSGNEPVVVETYTLNEQTLRRATDGFPAALRTFVASERNLSSATSADIDDIAACLANSTNPIFGDVVEDNEIPTITVTSAALVSEGAYTLTGRVTDNGGVSTVQVLNDSTNLGTLTPDPDGAFSVELDLPCNTALELVLVAVDTAGNRGTTGFQWRCDSQAPTLTEIESSYTPASATTLTPQRTTNTYSPIQRQDVSRAWSSTFTIEKFVNRLDGELDSDTQPNNLPAIRFTLSDNDSTSSVFTEVAALQVRYRYQVRPDADTDWDTPRDWTELPIAADNQNVLPIALQTLSPVLISRSTEHHRVQIEITDAADNAQIYTFEFRLALYAPPIVVHSCAVDRDFDDLFNVRSGALATFYNSTTAVDFFARTIQWNFELPSDTLLDTTGIELAIEGSVRSDVTSLSFLVDRPETSSGFLCSGEQCACGFDFLRVREVVGRSPLCLDLANGAGNHEYWNDVDGAAVGSRLNNLTINRDYDNILSQDHSLAAAIATPDGSADPSVSPIQMTPDTEYLQSVAIVEPRFVDLLLSPFDWTRNNLRTTVATQRRESSSGDRAREWDLELPITGLAARYEEDITISTPWSLVAEPEIVYLDTCTDTFSFETRAPTIFTGTISQGPR